MSTRFPMVLLDARRLMLLAALSACGALTPPEPLSTSSVDFEPPKSWESGLFFSIADSTLLPELPYGARVEFGVEGAVPQVASGRDLFQAPNGEVRTPWYAIPLNVSREGRVSIRVVVADRNGAESTADHVLTVERDVFYEVHLGVASRPPVQPHAPPLLEGITFYPVHAGAQRAPSDSLVIGYKTRSRQCFDCRF